MEGKSGKIIVKTVDDDKLPGHVQEFWDTYTKADPEDDLSKYLEDQLDRTDFAEIHEMYERGDVEGMKDFLEYLEQSTNNREYYPGVFGAELEVPSDPKRIKRRGGRVEMAGGGGIKRALKKIQEARFELEQSSDPDIDLIAREMMKDPDTRALGRRIMDNERKVADPTMKGEDAEKYYERISRLFDEAEAKAALESEE